MQPGGSYREKTDNHEPHHDTAVSLQVQRLCSNLAKVVVAKVDAIL